MAKKNAKNDESQDQKVDQAQPDVQDQANTKPDTGGDGDDYNRTIASLKEAKDLVSKNWGKKEDLGAEDVQESDLLQEGPKQDPKYEEIEPKFKMIDRLSGLRGYQIDGHGVVVNNGNFIPGVKMVPSKTQEGTYDLVKYSEGEILRLR